MTCTCSSPERQAVTAALEFLQTIMVSNIIQDIRTEEMERLPDGGFRVMLSWTTVTANMFDRRREYKDFMVTNNVVTEMKWRNDVNDPQLKS